MKSDNVRESRIYAIAVQKYNWQVNYVYVWKKLMALFHISEPSMELVGG